MATESDKKLHQQLIHAVDTIGVEFSAVQHQMQVHQVLGWVSSYVCSQEALLERLRLTHENYLSAKKKKQGTFNNRDISSKNLDIQKMVCDIDMFGIELSARAHNVEPQFVVNKISGYRASQGALLQRLRLAQETYYKGKETDDDKDKQTTTTCNQQQIVKKVQVQHTSDKKSRKKVQVMKKTAMINRPLQKKQVMNKNRTKTIIIIYFQFLVSVSGFIAYFFMRKAQ